MTQLFRRLWMDASASNALDYLFSWIASALAAFSCGQAIGSTPVSWFGLTAVTLGVVLSYLIRHHYHQTKFIRIDGILYCIGSWIAVFFAFRINAELFPPETFPRELSPSAWLLWMLIFGSFFTWRDGTLLFQSIPALAMFGFVGCYDTYRPVVFLFFIFLVCFALLFARAHARDMQYQAEQSGYFRVESKELSSGFEKSEILHQGPWRWAAGAEWALGSALIVVVLSLLGAPVIQQSARPISGIIAVRSPRIRSTNNPLSSVAQNSDRTAVSNGPVSLRDLPYFEIQGDTQDYYRTSVYSTWDGRNWFKNWRAEFAEIANRPVTPGQQPAPLLAPINGMTRFDPKTLSPVGALTTEQQEAITFPNIKPDQQLDEYRSQEYNVRALVPTNEIPQHGNNPLFSSNSGTSMDSSGLFTLGFSDRYRARVLYDPVREPTDQDEVPTILNFYLARALEEQNIDARIKNFARKVTEGARSDLERARLIRERISQTITYDMRTERAPNDVDVAAYCLFESKTGYCDAFATSMVLMARSVGIPARYAIGYLAEPKNVSPSGVQTILENDRHAWAELYFKNVGWVIFDATIGAEIAEGGGRKESKPNDPNAVLNFLRWALNAIIIVLLVVAAGVYWRMKHLPRTPEVLRSELEGMYMQFTEQIRRTTGRRRTPSETTNEYLHRVMPGRADVLDLGRQFEDALFGPESLSQEKLSEFNQKIKEFSDRLKSESKIKQT